MSVRDDLIAARELISDPKRWTCEQYARDKTGYPVNGNDDHAVCWCADGALGKVMNLPDGRYQPFQLLDSACRSLFQTSIHNTNDNLGHEAILKAFDLAIQNAEVSNVG